MMNQQTGSATLLEYRRTPAAAPSRPTAVSASLALTPDRHSVRTDLPVTLALLGDTSVILLSQALAFWLRFRSGWFPVAAEAGPVNFLEYMRLIVVGTTLLLFTFAHLRVYSARNLINFTEASERILKGTGVWIFAFLAISLALDFQPPISRLFALLSYMGCVLFILPWRAALSGLLKQERFIRNFRRRVLCVGWNRDADQLTAAFAKDPHHLYEIVGCVPSPRGGFQAEPPTGLPTLGSFRDLEGLLTRKSVDVVVLTDLRLVMEDVVRLANLCEKEYVDFKVVPAYFPMALTKLHLETISGVPILGALPSAETKSYFGL